MPELEPYALISLEDARGFLQKEEGENAQDDEIAGLINAASLEIAGECRREFAPATEEAEERVFVYRPVDELDPDPWLNLDPYDLRELEAITLYTDLDEADQVELEAPDWRLRPVPARDGAYQWIKLLKQPTSECEVTVSGQWGCAAVPADVAHWCKVTVAIWLRRDVAAFSRTLQIDEDRVEKPRKLPEAVIDGLRKHGRGWTIA